MGIFARTTSSAAHAVPTAPELAGQLDLDGTEYPLPADDAPAPGRRSFRSPGQMSGHAAADVSSISDEKSARSGEHLTRGAQDTRRGYSPSAPDPAVAPSPEQYVNQREAVALTPEAPPPRFRGGWTGADPARPALSQRAYLLRPFDKSMAEHPGRVTHADMPAPLAARPPVYGDLAGGLPGAMGRTGTERQGIGTRPNTFRLLPKAWDALALNTGGPAVTSATPDPAQAASSRERGRSWRL